jgi:hypothetical protein
MKICKVDVYDLSNAIIASGYPFLTEYEARTTVVDADVNRAIKLAKNSSSSGHGNFLKGILVSADIVASAKWWIQADRYEHFVIVSSMSTMHRALAMPLEKVCPNIPGDLMAILKREKERCKNGEISLEEFVKLIPSGIEYGARVSMNYLQLRTMYNQRRSHVLSEWKTFCDWCETLPYADKFITIDRKVEARI